LLQMSRGSTLKEKSTLFKLSAATVSSLKDLNPPYGWQ